MTVTTGYHDFVVERLQGICSITSRRMFGAVGLYAEGYFFALIDDDRLYFKVDDTNRPDFEAAAMGPFRPYGDDRAMQYYEVPIDVLEDSDMLAEWVEKALAVSRRSKSKKGSSR